MERVESFGPVFAPDARVLILGTAPSVQSLAQGFFYGHPRNCFWRMAAEVLGETAPASIEEKKAMLIKHRVALWDVVRSCQRQGSLDSAIRAAQPNDIESLIARLPGLERVLLNGGTAARLFRQAFPALWTGMCCQVMPSTSPAYTLSYEEKLGLWKNGMCGMEES